MENGRLELSRWAEVCDGWQLLDRPDLAVKVESLPPSHGFRPPLERRPQQTVHVLRGELQVELDGKLYVLHRGDGLQVPAGRSHRLWNDSDDEARVLVVSTPAMRDRWELHGSPSVEAPAEDLASSWDDEESDPFAATHVGLRDH